MSEEIYDNLKSGIYKITNIINNKCYIGQSRNIKQRITNHFNQLKRNTHNNKYLQRSYNKYGKDNFINEILCHCPITSLSSNESFYIKNFNSYIRKLGYNLTEDCNTHLEITKKKIGIKNKETLIKNNINKKLNARKVNQYSLNGDFIKTWKSSCSIKDYYKLSIGNLNTYLNNFTTTKSLVGYMWKWDDANINPIKPYIQGKPKKSIIIYKNNIFYKKFDKIQDACASLNIHRSTIERSIKGIAINSQGLTFKILR
jgi:group I intron endonuclease